MSEKRSWEDELEGGRRELWVRLAWGVGAATLVMLLYLGLKPGGSGPIYVYGYGRGLLFLVASALLLFGIGRSMLRRPVLQRGRLAAFAFLAGSVYFAAYPLAYPSSYDGRPSQVRFRPPFEAPEAEGLSWVVRWGGPPGEGNPMVFLPDRRYGFDFVICDEKGASRGRDEYFARGERVLAPAAGRVVVAHDGEPDAARGKLPSTMIGNHLAIEVAPGQYAFLTGLAQGSLEVALGDEVEAGEPVARVGHSAYSAVTPEPFLGLHLQDTLTPQWGEGIPLLFDFVRGDKAVEREAPGGGLRKGRHTGVRLAPAPAPARD